MVNYKIASRRKIEDFLRKSNRPVLQTEVQRLGSGTWHLRHDTVLAVLRELADDGKIIVRNTSYGKMNINTYEWMVKE